MARVKPQWRSELLLSSTLHSLSSLSTEILSTKLQGYTNLLPACINPSSKNVALRKLPFAFSGSFTSRPAVDQLGGCRSQAEPFEPRRTEAVRRSARLQLLLAPSPLADCCFSLFRLSLPSAPLLLPLRLAVHSNTDAAPAQRPRS